MRLAVVQGEATSTIRHRSLAGQKLLVCQGLDSTATPAGDPMLVIDQLGAGEGQVVAISSDGQGMRERLNDESSPARWFTLGIVDPGQRLGRDEES